MHAPLIAPPAEAFEAWRRLAVMKTLQPFGKRFPAALFGGALIGVGTLGGIAVVSSSSTPADFVLLGLCLSCSISVVLLSGSEFFTSNSALVGTLYWGNQTPWWMYFVDLARKWLGNFIGALLWALITIGAGTFGYDATAQPGEFGALTHLGTALCATAKAKVDGPNAWELIFRGGIIGALVGIAIFAALAMNTPIGRIAPIFLCVPLAVLAGADHAISNMFTFSVATIIKCPVSNHGMYWRNLGLTTLGTLIFSFAFGSLVYLQNAASISAEATAKAQAAAHQHHERNELEVHHEPDSESSIP